MRDIPGFGLGQKLQELAQQGEVMLEGAYGAATALALVELARARPATDPILVITPDPESAAELLGDLELMNPRQCVLPFPAWDLLPIETEHPDLEVAHERVAVLRRMQDLARAAPAVAPTGEPAPMVLAPVMALLQPTVSPALLEQGSLAVSVGMEISPEDLTARLLAAGLEHLPRVDTPGQFCRRGGIMDVFPLFARQPVRIEFFGDTIDTIRFFDPVSQAGEEAFDQRVVLVSMGRDCFRVAYEQDPRYSLLDHLPRDTLLVIMRPVQVEHLAGLYLSGFGQVHRPVADFARLAGAARCFARVCVPELAGEDWPATWGPARALVRLNLGATSLERLRGGLDSALAELARLLRQGTKVHLFCHNHARQQRLAEILAQKLPESRTRVRLVQGHLSAGFLVRRPAPDTGRPWALVTDHELCGRFAMRQPRRRRWVSAPVSDFTRLAVGDYVVHLAHGIARYQGIRTLERNGAVRDYLELRFAEDTRIYVPLSHVELVQRYVGGRGARPALSRLGGKQWSRRKQAAAAAARDVAADLLRLQAVRRARPGIAFPEDDELQREFDGAFPYEETPDQAAATAEIKADQVAATPMDRLLCGDVGFGKTELAMRAAFKVVLAGRQVALLVPTTILAEQHLRTFNQRLADYPVLVGCLSRFRTPAAQRELIAAARAGRVDILIGTHRLLSPDVGFKNLGLVIIDEEQRFGVEHKERLKRMRTEVDVLTMTATPIPRTLHMSLMGLRDISNLATPPAQRRAIRTLVTRFSPELVRRAILRELARGGQCYFVHNRVRSINHTARQVAELVPEARVAVAHGQMPEKDLLAVMVAFLDHEVDVLVCSTIIESGVDIPSVNTLIVNDADRFGLSELHQLRGRVGRYRHQAYAYFLVPTARPLTPVAHRRLRALEEYAQLGAGFHLAMRDLEIRGAGNVLGLEQSGQIQLVGFDLYCRLLERAVEELRGEQPRGPAPVELELPTRAFVPAEYIPDQAQRVEFYRRLTACLRREGLEELRAYARKRWGQLPASVEQCFADQELRIRAAAAGIDYLGQLDGGLAVGFTRAAARQGVLRLRALGDKTTPVGEGRWRMQPRPGEEIRAAALRVVETLEN